jgi:ABC-2 type transport system ATP-binding protein
LPYKSFVLALAAMSLAAAGCSSSTAKSADSTATTAPSASTSTTTTVPGGPYTRPACTLKPTAPPVATRVAGSTSDYDLVSFDGTKIRIHWFPLHLAAGKTAPTVLKGPGWGQAGDTNTTTSNYGLFGDVSIRSLNTSGYNVLTFDPRGFGKSGGTVETDSADYEGRDVERMLDWVAAQPGVQLDGPGDPRVGMVGASYGGGIQLITAAIDCRVDAIVPQIAWHSLSTSLYKAQTVKTGWGDLLYRATAGHSIDPHITSAYNAGNTTGVLTAADAQWFIDRGPADLVNKITAPTLFEQGTIDTLFTLDEATTNYGILKANGVPTAMLWMCSGHGVCLTNPGDAQLPGRDTIAWLNRYVKGNTAAELPPPFEYVDQKGDEYTASEFPPPASAEVSGEGTGTLKLIATGGAGPAHATGNAGALGGIALGFTPAKAANAVNIPITVADAAQILGAPKLTLDYSGTVPAGVHPTRVFAQVVDDSTGLVLGNQITPIQVTLDGKAHTTTVPLEQVVFNAQPGARLTLQLVATTTAYATPRLGGTVTFSSVHVELPTVTGVTRSCCVS